MLSFIQNFYQSLYAEQLFQNFLNYPRYYFFLHLMFTLYFHVNSFPSVLDIPYFFVYAFKLIISKTETNSIVLKTYVWNQFFISKSILIFIQWEVFLNFKFRILIGFYLRTYLFLVFI
jgi:hypothetical protein